ALGNLGLRGTLSADGPIEIGQAAPPAPLAKVEKLNLKIESEALARGAKLTGGATVDGAALAIDADARDFVEAAGRVTPRKAQGAASLVLKGLRPAVLAALVPAQAELISAALRDPVDLTAKATRSGADLGLDVSASSPQTTLALK